VNTVGGLAALVVGAAFGYVAQRGAFCMNSAFRGPLERDWTKVKALGLAVAVQLLVLPLFFATGLARPAALPFAPLAAMAGGLLFGFSMSWAGGCAAGVWYKLGAGDVGALLAVVGMALGATAADLGPFAGMRTSLQTAVSGPVSWTAPPALSLAVGLLVLGGLASSRDSRAGAWSWRRTGFLVGVVAACAWPVSAIAGRRFGLAIIPGTTGLLSAVSGRPFPAWDSLLVLGIAIGGWRAARQEGPFTPRAPGSAALLKRFTGGVGLGIGASIATGCTVGQGLTGLALLAPSSFVVMGAIFAGSAVATLVGRRLHPAAGPAVGSPLPAEAEPWVRK
jgi:uncharacterized membrane protein YedE/YeeE